MDCKQAKHQCQSFLDGQIQPEGSREIDQHLTECACCRETYDSQRTFHSLLKKVSFRSADPIALPALKKNLLERLSSGGLVSGTIDASALFRVFSPNVRNMPARPSVAAAAACMFFLSGVISFQTFCVNGQCRLVRGAQHEYDNIVAGNRMSLASSNNREVLEKSIQTTGLAESLKSIPNLDTCDMEAECCGPVCIPGLPKGVYVKYVQSKGGHEPMTLMVINTPYSPAGEEYKEFRTAQHCNRNVVSWHGANNGPLYILVTQMSMRETVSAAESIIVAKR